ncbi:ribosome-releasing factor 2, mitochondrial [Dermacentor andersoni]|uniref:ribosome-releasing factor 2, mitochondrial n=1 Tax=Dermacentor andersoni TaxID=34620 RepID=UPI002155C5B7|nr:ribosome-releasing factor 2, mitochondrial-like [Dermacentor andersoni]
MLLVRGKPSSLLRSATPLCRCLCTAGPSHSERSELPKHKQRKVRNIGIVAHVDAGKTTITERILFYSGLTRAMGEVHDGDTVTDCLPQERERGISITAATVTFPWRDHRVNLIDTPGHVDFSMEVERSLRVMDGAVTLLDGSEGVQAQTITVWEQACRHNLPRLIFVNKMDKAAASFDACISDVRSKLGAAPLVVQLPLKTADRMVGIVDLVSMETHMWPADSHQGRVFTRAPLGPGTSQYEKAAKKRQELIEAAAELDDQFADEFLLQDRQVPPDDLMAALRRITVAGKGAPMLCGSAYRNLAVQPLLDAVIDFLPEPVVSDGSGQLAALAFKVVHTKFKGPLTFVRLYGGRITMGQRLYNATRDVSEKAVELVEVTADEYRTVREALAGDVLAIAGLQHSVTGDLLVANAATARSALEGPAGQRAAMQIPEPVLLCSIEAPSMRHQNALDAALACMLREDPALRLSHCPDTGQMVLGGLGQLHLEVTRDRILLEHNVDASLGPLQVAYREAPTDHAAKSVRHLLDRAAGGTNHRVEVEMRVLPSDAPFRGLKVVVTDDNNLGRLWPQHRRALDAGVSLALSHGPLRSFPVINASIELLWCEVGRGTSLAMVTAAASQCTAQCLANAAVVLMEPIMKVQVSIPEMYLGRMLSDLSQRRATIREILQRQDMRVVNAEVPLAEMNDYADVVRTLSSGRASFSMSLAAYHPMGAQETAVALRRLSGFTDNA